jgi:hypothetical protein
MQLENTMNTTSETTSVDTQALHAAYALPAGDIAVLHGSIGLNSPKLDHVHVIIVRRGIYSRTGRTTGNVDEGSGVRIEVYPRGLTGHWGRERAYSETLYAPDRWDPSARNNIGTLGAYCDQWPAQSEIDAAIERARAYLLTPPEARVLGGSRIQCAAAAPLG